MVNSPGPFCAGAEGGGGAGLGSFKGAAFGVAAGALYPCINMVSSPGPFLAPGRGEAGWLEGAKGGGFGLGAEPPPVRNICVNEPALGDSAGGAGAAPGLGSGGGVFTVACDSNPEGFAPDPAWLPTWNICVNEPGLDDAAGGVGVGAGPGTGACVLTVACDSSGEDFVPDAP